MRASDLKFAAGQGTDLEVIPDGGVNGTTSYTGLLSLGDPASTSQSCHACKNQLLITYDRLGNGWSTLKAGQDSAVFSVQVSVSRL